MQRFVILGLLFAFSIACGSAQPSGPAHASASHSPHSSYSPTWVLVTIDAGHITPKPNAEPWDEADTTPTLKDTAESLASLLSFADATVGMVAQGLASLIPPSQPSSDVTLPDPQIVITYNETVSNRRITIPTVHDTVSPTWRYTLFARTDNLRERGLELEVVDDDGERTERIALVNVPRALLQQVAESGLSQEMDLRDGALERLRVRLEPVANAAPVTPSHFVLPLRQGLISTHVAVPRGAIITVRVSDAGKVGNGGLLGLGCPTDVTPAGLPAGVCREHNLKGMPALLNSAHGSAVALIGQAPDVHAVSLANGDAASTCVRFAAPASGELVLGTNDRDSSDNEGEFTFDVEIAPPPEPPLEVSESPTPCP